MHLRLAESSLRWTSTAASALREKPRLTDDRDHAKAAVPRSARATNRRGAETGTRPALLPGTEDGPLSRERTP